MTTEMPGDVVEPPVSAPEPDPAGPPADDALAIVSSAAEPVTLPPRRTTALEALETIYKRFSGERGAVRMGGRIEEVAVAVGACSAVAQRLRRLETAILGRRAGEEALAAVSGWAFDELSPIDDVRATAAYRRKAAAELTRRALREAFSRLGEDTARRASEAA